MCIIVVVGIYKIIIFLTVFISLNVGKYILSHCKDINLQRHKLTVPDIATLALDLPRIFHLILDPKCLEIL